jgi:NAD-dependent dihydropyrimidine dehydrogenase PreA subunit
MKSNNDIYRQLQRHLDSMPIPFPESESGYDIKLLQHFFTPDEAQIALELSALPEPVNRIHQRLKETGISLNELESALDKLVEKGSILGGKIFESKGKGKLYSKAPLAIGMYEFQAGRLTKELESDFQGYLHETFYKAAHSKKTSQIRTIPISKGINTDRYVDSYDNVRNIVKNTKKSIGVITCVCREGKDLLEESCKHSDIRETCLIFEDIASSAIDSGGAREISKEETLLILDKAEDAGFVLQPENTQKPNFICCCCGDCCNVLTTVKKFPKPAEYYHSNYFSKVDSGKCDQCWDCIEICPMDALEMEDDAPSVDLDRCIGCGVCVSKCKSGAYGLIAKDTKHTPPKDSEAMYKRILVERIGIGGMLKTLPKMIFHQKI